jgi:hypothetical protein
MDMNLNQNIKQLFTVLLLFILPLILLVIGTLAGLANAVYYLIIIIWFGIGLIFYSAIR